MNTLLVWIMVAVGSPAPHHAPQAYYHYPTQVDCLRARGKLAHYDDRLKRQWTCESIRIAAPAEVPVDPAAVERARRNYQHEQDTLDRILIVPKH